jgi:endo-alpha-1,4-polygalactosaminidase (GH114 family)
VIDLLTEYQAAGLPIFAVDYLSEPDKMEQFVEEARERGYIPYAGVRELDRLLPAP